MQAHYVGGRSSLLQHAVDQISRKHKNTEMCPIWNTSLHGNSYKLKELKLLIWDFLHTVHVTN